MRFASRYESGKYMCTKAKATFLCFVAWIAAALCTSPIIWVSQYQEVGVKESKNDQDSWNYVPVCLTTADTGATVVFFLLLVILFYVAPLLVLLVLYTFIVGQLMPDSGNDGGSYHARAKKHAITMLLSVVVSFFLCLSPYRILILYIVIAPVEQITAIDRDTFFAYLNFSRIMFYLHSAIDPILYNLMSSKFRRGFWDLCRMKNHSGRERGSPMLLMTTYEEEETKDGTCIPTCNTVANSFWPISFVLFTIVVFFVIPLFILVVLYTVIARHLMTNSTISRGSSNNLLKYRKQVMLMLGTVVFCFFLCLLPFRALTLWILVVPIKVIVDFGIERYFTLLYFCRVMFYLNSAINPILYNLMSTKFREGFLRLCGLGPHRKKKKKTSEKTGTCTTGSTNCSSNHSDFWRRHSSNKSSSVKTPSNNAAAEKQVKVPLQTTVVSGSVARKKQESYV
ncbi:hypothetical protein E2986_02604 [Frieseomelitta varia]|uniref:G-protein coupled receptors family 1 profile domain-containing protein n=1 Tax=Frieseomelitta varia TaxID=561572 RepID=A0A833W5C6_9HYME|nr:hypothetical protein E2986_02604 [Frieseomelitta varia]